MLFSFSQYDSLPPAAQAACAKAGGAVLGNVLGGAWSALTRKDPGAAFAGVYGQWRDGLPDAAVDDEKLGGAFGEFFCRPLTIRELDKLLRGEYQDVDFAALEREFRESCEGASCPVPQVDQRVQLYACLRDLRTVLEDSPRFRREHQLSLQSAIRELSRSEAVVRNHALAREQYLAWVARQHRCVRFSGMAEFGGPPEIEMARIFVMPKVVSVAEWGAPPGSFTKPVAAWELLAGRETHPRMVIVGAPGAGKTTLLECLTLALARGPEPFEWARDFPPLLPVFCRVRDLDRDLERHATIWDCLRFRCRRSTGLRLPVDFFPHQMESGGLIFLFDGLDEASSPARCNRIAGLIEEFAGQLSPDSRVLITSRPHDCGRRFGAAAYRHFEFCEFGDKEIQAFIQRWRQVHEPDRAAPVEKSEPIWKGLRARREIEVLARNALMLTIIVRVHSGLGALPGSRLGLYAKCTETLLKHWAQANDLPPGPIDYDRMRRLLEKLAFELQREAGGALADCSPIRIPRAQLAHRVERYLAEEGAADTLSLAERVIDRLHARDAILVQCAGDQFGFLHRGFQEYFAACWMARELSEPEFREILFPGTWEWSETLILAVAQLPGPRRREVLLEQLKQSWTLSAAAYLKVAAPEEFWLAKLVQFLSRYTWEGEEFEGLAVAECAEACAGRAETTAVLQAMFAPDKRMGPSLAAAVELAEELSRRGDAEARRLLESFFAEAADLPEDMVLVEASVFPYGKDACPVHLESFYIDRNPVTNLDFERMVPGHRMYRNDHSDADDQPVIYVNWPEARLYARWRGPGRRLPTEQEWEKAASWDAANQKKRIYPWGDEFDASLANTGKEEGPQKTSPVGAYPEGRSPYGCCDMAGNVWDWTESLWSQELSHPVLRGGGWSNLPNMVACSYRNTSYPRLHDSDIGFRCART